MSYEKKKENNEIENIHVKNGISLSQNIHVENGMLVFANFEEYNQTIKVLAKENEAYDDDFLKKWGNLKEDELDDKEDELKYNPDLVFLKFETQFKGFFSLRKQIKDKEEKWLNHEVLDDKNDPDNHFIFDIEERAVLNTRSQVKIGKSIFQMTMFGDLEVTDGDIKTANLIHSQNALKLKLKNVIIHGSYDGTIDNSNTQATTTSTATSGSTSTNGSTNTNPSLTCKTNINATSYYYYGRYKIKGYQKLTGYGRYRTKIKAKTRHFKKRRRRWKCRRGPIGVKITGDAKFRMLVSNVCDAAPDPYKNKYKSRKRRVKVKDVELSLYSSNDPRALAAEQHNLKTEHRRNNSNNFFYFWN
jgi:hypothetical protein